MDGEFTLTRNQTIYVRLTDNAGNYGGTATSNPNKIDTVAPTVSGVTVESTTTSTIKVTATATDATATTTSCQSGVYSYSFYNSKTNTWSNYQTSSSYTFSGLSSGTNYTIKVKAKDKAGNISGEKSITATTLAAYTVTYYANGGTGAPASQTKTHGTALTLSSTIPTRNGYSFIGWGTSPDGSVYTQPYGTYSTDANLSLYALWQLKSGNRVVMDYSHQSDSSDFKIPILVQKPSYGGLTWKEDVGMSLETGYKNENVVASTPSVIDTTGYSYVAITYDIWTNDPNYKQGDAIFQWGWGSTCGALDGYSYSDNNFRPLSVGYSYSNEWIKTAVVPAYTNKFLTFKVTHPSRDWYSYVVNIRNLVYIKNM